MYNVKINLIGCDERVVPPESRAILKRWGLFSDEYPNIRSVFKNVLMVEDEMRLLVVYLSSADDLSELKRLSGSYPKYAILAVIDADCDPTLAVKCMRAGAMQVVHAPVEPHDLEEALDCIGTKQGGLTSLAKVITVTGSVGGCGATTVAINLAYELARQTKKQCILMELALRKGMLAHYLDIAPRYTTAALAADIQRVDGVILQGALTEVADNLNVLVGPYESIETESVQLESVAQLVQLTRHLASSLILDVPSTYDDLFFRSLADADQIVLVADQTVAAIRGAQMICAGLSQSCKPLIIINRYDAKLTGLSADRIQSVLPTCELFTIAADPTVSASTSSGQPLRMYAPRSAALADFEKVIARLAPQTLHAGSDKGGDSLFSRLGRALSLSERTN